MENESLLSARAVKTNRRIHAAFFSLLRQKEFGKITVSDIAREAGINRKTFYAYYTDLDELWPASRIHCSTSIVLFS